MSSGPTFWHVARRPRWIAALLLVLLVASVFAALGRWQLERSFAASTVNEIDTETAVPLASVAEPGTPVDSQSFARIVTTSGEFAPDGFVVLHGRLHRGEPVYWLVGRLITDEDGPTSLAVALGWADSEAAAIAAIPAVGDGPRELQGRYLPGEEPRDEDLETGERSALSIAELVNVWPGYSGDVYAGYLILSDAPPGLGTIDAPPPLPEQQVNLLNLFYAVEWAIFGGFAIYLWWRLVKDAQEAEVAEAAQAPPDLAAVHET